jgi:hypothetical protein
VGTFGEKKKTEKLSLLTCLIARPMKFFFMKAFC